MDTIFRNSENSKTSEPHVLLLNLTDKLDLRRGEKSLIKSQYLLRNTWKNIKSSNNSNKFKISCPIWNDKFELPYGSCSVSDIQDYFEYILKEHGENIDNPSIKILVNKTENRITFKFKTGYYLELLTPKAMKLLGSTENKISNDKNCENVPHREITEAMLFIATFSIMIINMIQQFYILLFQINHLENYQKFLQQILPF